MLSLPHRTYSGLARAANTTPTMTVTLPLLKGHVMASADSTRLTIIGPGSKKKRLLCRCSCGNEKEIWACHVRSGATRSCGCLVADNNRKLRQRLSHGDCAGGKLSAEYRVWVSMMSRCSNPMVKSYPNYGGRGIIVCEKWKASFSDFLADVGRRPGPKHSLDRFPNNNGNYEPGNVRWATAAEQNRNTSKNHNLEYAGKTMCIADWSKETGLSRRTILRRLAGGWSIDVALTLPVEGRLTNRRAARGGTP